MPKGGRREGAGRPKGPSKLTIEVRTLARAYGPKAVQKLARLAGLTDEPPAESELIQLGAVRELLDRGYGRVVRPGDDAMEDGRIVIITGVRRDPPPMVIDAESDEMMISTGIHRHNGA